MRNATASAHLTSLSGIDVTDCHAHASLIVLNVSTGRHICILTYIQVIYCIYIFYTAAAFTSLSHTH